MLRVLFIAFFCLCFNSMAMDLSDIEIKMLPLESAQEVEGLSNASKNRLCQRRFGRSFRASSVACRMRRVHDYGERWAGAIFVDAFNYLFTDNPTGEQRENCAMMCSRRTQERRELTEEEEAAFIESLEEANFRVMAINKKREGRRQNNSPRSPFGKDTRERDLKIERARSNSSRSQ